MIAPRICLASVAGCATILLSVVLTGHAYAQVPDPAQAGPAPVEWQGNAVLSVSIQAGVTDQRTVSVSADAFRRAPTWSYSIQADHTHSSIDIADVGFTTVADSQNARFTAERGLTEIFYLVIRPAFKRNEVQAVDYRYELLGGLGARLLRNPRAQLAVLGVAGGVNQKKNVPEVDGADGVAGVVQTSAFVFTEAWRIQQLVLFLHPFNAGDDYRFQFQGTLTGAIAGPLALNVSYSLDRENIVLGGNDQTDRRLSVGVQVNF